MQEKTILGVRLRRTIITFVNGMGRGKGIRVYFRGTRAYTNGTDMNLPAIRDLAEIPYPVARALIGYAIHEVAHIRETDFDAIIRDRRRPNGARQANQEIRQRDRGLSHRTDHVSAVPRVRRRPAQIGSAQA